MLGLCFAVKAQSVDIYDVQYKDNGKTIEVTVKVWPDSKNAQTNRVKVTPVDWVKGAVVQASQYVDVTTYDGKSNTGKVTFSCTATKEGDPAVCNMYNFKAEIVRR